MGAQVHNFKADDSEWIKAAGLDLAFCPATETLKEFFDVTFPKYKFSDDQQAILSILETTGWLDMVRHYALDERLGKLGIKIVDGCGGTYDGFGDYNPKALKLSNGICLAETRDSQKEAEFLEADPDHPGFERYKEEFGFELGYDFVFCYKVVQISEEEFVNMRDRKNPKEEDLFECDCSKCCGC